MPVLRVLKVKDQWQEPLKFCLPRARLRRGGAELDAERHGVEDGLFSLKGTDLEAGALARVTKSKPSAHCGPSSVTAELLTCNPGNSYAWSWPLSKAIGTCLCVDCLVLSPLLAEMLNSSLGLEN